MNTDFVSVGKFEQRQNGSVWEFRPNPTATRRVAKFHAGCLTLVAIPVLVSAFGGLAFFVFAGIVFLFGKVLNDQNLTILAWIFAGVLVFGITPLLVLWGKHIYRKSLRDNGLIMQVSPNGPILMGERVLVEASIIKHVLFRTVEESDGEGGTTISHYVSVVQPRECAADIPIPIPCLGMWNDSVLDKPDAERFAEALAGALGVVVGVAVVK